MKNRSSSTREQKIKNLIALINGDISPRDIKAKRSVLCIQWNDEDPEDPENIYIIDSKSVDYKTYLKAIS